MPYLPYSCPDCGADLEQRGAVIFWYHQPERAAAHLEPGEEDGVIVVLDVANETPEISLQCSDCGADLQFLIEEVCPDYEFEERVEEGKKADDE